MKTKLLFLAITLLVIRCASEAPKEVAAVDSVKVDSTAVKMDALKLVNDTIKKQHE